MAKPQPRVVSEVCSLCGLDWKRHGKTPTQETCIGLLLDEVRSLNARLAHQPTITPYPYPVLPRLYIGPFWTTSVGQSSKTYYTNAVVSHTATLTPAASSRTPQAIGSGSHRG